MPYENLTQTDLYAKADELRAEISTKKAELRSHTDEIARRDAEIAAASRNGDPSKGQTISLGGPCQHTAITVKGTQATCAACGCPIEVTISAEGE